MSGFRFCVLVNWLLGQGTRVATVRFSDAFGLYSVIVCLIDDLNCVGYG